MTEQTPTRVDKIEIASGDGNVYLFMGDQHKTDQVTVLGIGITLPCRQEAVIVFIAVRGFMSESEIRHLIIEPWLNGETRLKGFASCQKYYGSNSEYMMSFSGSILMGTAVGPTAIVKNHDAIWYSIAPKTDATNSVS